MADKYPTIQFREHEDVKNDFKELAQLRGTTVSAMLKGYIATELASLPRERRIAKGLPVETAAPGEDFLN